MRRNFRLLSNDKRKSPSGLGQVCDEEDKRAADCHSLARLIAQLFSNVDYAATTDYSSIQTAVADLASGLAGVTKYSLHVLQRALLHELFSSIPPKRPSILWDVTLLPSRNLLLLNLLCDEIDDAPKDVLEEVTDACRQFGVVLNVCIRLYAKQVGIVVQFERSSQCQQAQSAMNRRTFDGRAVQAFFCWDFGAHRDSVKS